MCRSKFEMVANSNYIVVSIIKHLSSSSNQVCEFDTNMISEYKGFNVLSNSAVWDNHPP